MADTQVPYNAADMPTQFVVKRNVDGRDGYIFFTSVLAQVANDVQPWRKMKAGKHLNRYYHISSDQDQTGWMRCNIVKNGGTVQREIQWRRSIERLTFGGHTWPVLSVDGFQHFPAWHRIQSFVPRVTNGPTQPAPQGPAQPPPQVDQNGNKIYPIKTIPQHALRSLLTQALYEEHSCPIMDVPIDISNGAVTSCFHIFDKTALDRWLKQPGSGQKCPVCNQPCNSYTLQDGDDEVIEITGEA
jgi:hypothetical protein